jgi:hypothetical protein
MALAACGDTATQPSSSVAVSAPTRSPSFDYSSVGSRLGSQSSDFVVPTNGGTFAVGGLFSISFPANAICDPDQSTYGDTEWNNSCVVLNKSMAIHATLRLTSVGLAVDFQPELRFSPDAQVTVATDIFAPVITGNRDFFARYPSALRPLAVMYSPSMGASAVGDYLVDRDAITHVDLGSGRIWRRVKHFSGYLMGSGASCDPSPDQPDCVQVDQ